MNQVPTQREGAPYFRERSSSHFFLTGGDCHASLAMTFQIEGLPRFTRNGHNSIKMLLIIFVSLFN